ncbi:thioredoxin-like protein, partial [Serendipita vermifera]
IPTLQIAQEKPILLGFTATWCSSCKLVAPIFAALDKQNPDLPFYNVDVDQAEEVAEEVGIRMLPTFIIYTKGEQIACSVGAKPAELHTLIQTNASKRG